MTDDYEQVSSKTKIIGVLGAGTMGSGIALTALFADLRVTLYDVSRDMLDQAFKYIEHHLNRKRKAINIKYLTLTQDLADISGSQVVIEAIPEKLELKLETFSRLDPICPPPTVLATNTSTLSVTTIAASVDKPQRVAGMHFFNPAPVLPLVELIRGARTSAQTLEILERLAKQLGKTSVVAKDTPGFIVNRVARPFYGEALRLLGEGVASHELIDTIIEKGGGFRMGPFRLMDLIGIDVNYTATNSIYEQTFYEPRYRPHLIQQQMVGQRALGKKTGRGFYDYDGEAGAKEPDGYSDTGQKDWEVNVTPGSWVPNFVEKCKGAGFKINLTTGGKRVEGSTGNQIAIVIAGRRENLHEYLQSLDQSLPAEVPLLCQGADVTISQLVPALDHPERLAVFDGLFMDSGRVVTVVGSPTMREDIKANLKTFFRDLGYDTAWINESPGLVLPRTVCALVNEAAFAVGEGVAEPETIDTAMKLGTNYPRGPIEWGRQLGLDKVVDVLEHLESEYGEARYRVAPFLRRWSRLEKRSDSTANESK